MATRGLVILGLLIGDAEPDVQKALSWAFRSMALVDREATTTALAQHAERAARDGDGHRAWVIRDALAEAGAPPDRIVVEAFMVRHHPQWRRARGRASRR